MTRWKRRAVSATVELFVVYVSFHIQNLHKFLTSASRNGIRQIRSDILIAKNK